MDFAFKQWPPLKRLLNFYHFQGYEVEFQASEFSRLRKSQVTSPVLVLAAKKRLQLSFLQHELCHLVGCLPGFTDLQWRGFFFSTSLSAFLWVSKVVSFCPPPHSAAVSVVSVIRLFTWRLSVPANSISFFVDVQTHTNWNSVQHQMNWSLPPPPFFLTTGFCFPWRPVSTLKLCTV